jgi:hypothetical protein
MTDWTRLETRPVLARTSGADAGTPSAGVSSWTTMRQQRRQLAAKRIGLFGLFGSGNSGNDGSLDAMLRFLRQVRPDAQITCICSAQRGAPERIARTLHVASIPLGIPTPKNGLPR